MVRAAIALAAALLVSAPGLAQVPDVDAAVDPDELAAMLADLEASGGLLTRDEAALLTGASPGGDVPRGRIRGHWRVGMTLDPHAPPTGFVDLDAAGAGASARLRLRRRHDGDTAAGWASWTGRGLGLTAGRGSPAMGMGLLAAPTGARSSLSLSSSLAPARSGWRPSTSLGDDALAAGVVLRGEHGHFAGAAAVATDQAGRDLRWAWGRAGGVDAGVLQRGEARGGSVVLRRREGPWRIHVEGARWWRDRSAPPERAAAGWLTWTGADWNVEWQGATSRAASGLPGGVRPACLGGWWADGWALAVRRHRRGRWRWGGLYASGWTADTDRPEGGARNRRVLVEMEVAAPGSTGWEARVRRQVDTAWRLPDGAPWDPPERTALRQRLWLAGRVWAPWAGGRVTASWRRLEEDGGGRSFVAIQWQTHGRRVRWRAAAQAAWGEPLDLVTVSAATADLVRLQHWGRWRSGLALGAEGRGAWRWQAGVLVRRPADVDAGLDVEALVGVGRRWPGSTTAGSGR